MNIGKSGFTFLLIGLLALSGQNTGKSALAATQVNAPVGGPLITGLESIEGIEYIDISNENVIESFETQSDLFYGGNLRAYSTINWKVLASKTVIGTTIYSMTSGQQITQQFTYNPPGTNLYTGLFLPDGQTCALIKGSSGVVNQTFTINTKGNYKTCMQNNSSYSVDVTGTVYY